MTVFCRLIKYDECSVYDFYCFHMKILLPAILLVPIKKVHQLQAHNL